MKLQFLAIICLLLTSATIKAQSKTPSKNINGVYHLFKAEKGPSGTTNKMLIELAKNNGTIMLAVAACEKCYPAVYTYQPALSKKFGKPVYYNSSGIHVLTYDDNSFIICMAAISIEKDFNYTNFYSKSKAKVDGISQKKIASYASKILDYL